MKREIIFLVFLAFICLSGVVLAEETKQDIIIDSSLNDVYNLGEKIPLSIRTSSVEDISGTLKLDLICEGHEKNLMSINEYTVDSANKEELSYTLSLNNFQNMVGECKIRASFGDDQAIKEFEISDELDVNIKEISENIKPGENLVIKGDSLKQNPSSGEVSGFYTLELELGEETETIEGSVDNGFFDVNTTIPEKTAAKEYEGTVLVYEKGSGGKTNTGEAGFKFSVSQIPNNLELVLKEDQIKPGDSLEVKPILHDQTGENIEENSTISILNLMGNTVTKKNVMTGETFEYETSEDQEPGEWTVKGISEGMKSEKTFEVLENKETDVSIINSTLFIENTGNVPYNGSVEVNIGNNTEDVPAVLDVGESKEYSLSAPQGNYTVEVLADGEKKLETSLQLTGKTISIRETFSGSLIKNPIVWGFVIVVLGIVLYIVFRKGYKRSFIGRKIHKKKDSGEKLNEENQENKKNDKATEAMNYGVLPLYNNKAQLSLSIKGNKQSASMICLKIKNYDDIKLNFEGVKETMQKIVKAAEDSKTYIYESGDNIFFIFSPEITKTFKNEKPAVNTGIKIESILRNHNKYFKQKIDFGIAINRGEIITKKEKKELLFMSVGKLTTSVKKLASISNAETLLTKDIAEKLSAEVKTEKGEDKENKMEFYRVKEIKDRSNNQKFLNEFVKRYNQEGEEKK